MIKWKPIKSYQQIQNIKKNILEKYKARKEKFEDLSEFDRLEYKFRGI